jgi:uncharacterized protein (TIGR02466 family)
MIVEHIFTTAVAVEQLDLDNQALEEYCKQHIYASNAYAEDKETQTDYLDLKDPALAELVEIVRIKANELHVRLELHHGFHHTVKEAWANLNDPEPTRIPHQHAASAFTCVYYIKGDENSGPIRLMSPVVSKEQVVEPKHIDVYNGFTASAWDYAPVPGRLIIFPSWIYHFVQPNRSGSERMSIAFNTVFTEYR